MLPDTVIPSYIYEVVRQLQQMFSLYMSCHGHEVSSQQENLNLDKDGNIIQAEHNEANLMDLWNKIS